MRRLANKLNRGARQEEEGGPLQRKCRNDVHIYLMEKNCLHLLRGNTEFPPAPPRPDLFRNTEPPCRPSRSRSLQEYTLTPCKKCVIILSNKTDAKQPRDIELSLQRSVTLNQTHAEKSNNELSLSDKHFCRRNPPPASPKLK